MAIPPTMVPFHPTTIPLIHPPRPPLFSTPHHVLQTHASSTQIPPSASKRQIGKKIAFRQILLPIFWVSPTPLMNPNHRQIPLQQNHHLLPQLRKPPPPMVVVNKTKRGKSHSDSNKGILKNILIDQSGQAQVNNYKEAISGRNKNDARSSSKEKVEPIGSSTATVVTTKTGTKRPCSKPKKKDTGTQTTIQETISKGASKTNIECKIAPVTLHRFWFQNKGATNSEHRSKRNCTLLQPSSSSSILAEQPKVVVCSSSRIERAYHSKESLAVVSTTKTTYPANNKSVVSQCATKTFGKQERSGIASRRNSYDSRVSRNKLITKLFAFSSPNKSRSELGTATTAGDSILNSIKKTNESISSCSISDCDSIYHCRVCFEPENNIIDGDSSFAIDFSKGNKIYSWDSSKDLGSSAKITTELEQRVGRGNMTPEVKEQRKKFPHSFYNGPVQGDATAGTGGYNSGDNHSSCYTSDSGVITYSNYDNQMRTESKIKPMKRANNYPSNDTLNGRKGKIMMEEKIATNNTNTMRVKKEENSYDCKIPRPKLKMIVPTHSYGVQLNGNKNCDIVRVPVPRKDYHRKNNSLFSNSEPSTSSGGSGSNSGKSSDASIEKLEQGLSRFNFCDISLDDEEEEKFYNGEQEERLVESFCEKPGNFLCPDIDFC